MSSINSFTAAFDGLRQSRASGRMAHAYLVVGSPRGDALALAESLVQFLFCTSDEKPCGTCRECVKVREHAHPDVLWLQPESKSRRIQIQAIREELAPRISQTSYGGGWKVGVVVHADRLTDQAANAFLKMLEEPPGSSLLLLLTDSPEHLLPTIVSRCQRIVLSGGQQEEEGPWVEPLKAILREGVPSDSLEAMVQWAGLKAILDKVKADALAEETARAGEGGEQEESDDVREARLAARVLEARSRVMRYILQWQRDVLFAVLGVDASLFRFANEAEALRRQGGGLAYAEALRRVRNVEAMARRLERHVPEELVLEAGWGRAVPGGTPPR